VRELDDLTGVVGRLGKSANISIYEAPINGVGRVAKPILGNNRLALCIKTKDGIKDGTLNDIE
jgi:hypothetical protein